MSPPTLDRCATAIAGVRERYEICQDDDVGHVVWDNKDRGDKCSGSYEKCQAWIDREAARACIGAQWVSTADRLPEKPSKEAYEYVECLIFHRGEIKLRPWNCEHQVWDDEAHDDFFCEATEPTHWMALPEPPALTAVLSGEA